MWNLKLSYFGQKPEVAQRVGIARHKLTATTQVTDKNRLKLKYVTCNPNPEL
jgi:hypothetical protein